MNVRLNPRAASQLAALPVPAARRVVDALRILAKVPRSGRPYPADSDFRGLYYKTVVVRARRWSYRITYELGAAELIVHYFYPSWYPPTHVDRGAGFDEE